MIATSIAVLHAAAASHRMPLYAYLAQTGRVRLPLPEVQIFGGGAHAGQRTDIQDFMVMPLGAHSFDEALVMAAEVYRAAGELMTEAGTLYGVADEGGFWPAFDSNEQALTMVVRAIERAGYRPLEDIGISLDVAASELGSEGRYRLGLEGRELDTDGMCELLLSWIGRYPIVSIEDPLAEDDAAGMRRFTAAAGTRIQIIGDDFLVTNAQRVADAASSAACNAVLIKPNQAGTVTETRAALDAESAPASGPSSPPAPARPRTSRSCTSPSAGMPASSKSARSRVPSAWRSGTRGCASRRRWARPCLLRGARRSLICR